MDLAERFNGEVVNGDAMQMYRGLPIITNKISLEEQRGIPHHLLGLVDVNERPWTVEDFVSKALSTIDDIHRRQRLPILVGGTHYYLQSLLFPDNLAQPPRTRFDDTQKVKSNEGEWPILNASTSEMYAKLREVDPIMADRWHPNDRRKIQRSLEIYLQNGKKASTIYDEQRRRKHGTDVNQTGGVDLVRTSLRFPTLMLWTHASKDVLNTRLDERVAKMVEEGLVDEAKELDRVRKARETYGHPIDLTRGVWACIGYKEFHGYLTETNRNSVNTARLERLLAEAVEQTQTATRQYARNQLRWIRIKFVNALNDAAAKDLLFTLDTSKPSRRNDLVLNPACTCMKSFLDGHKLPDPRKVCPDAGELLVPRQEYDLGQRRDLWKRQTCELCGVTAVTENAWQQHMGGRSHQKKFKTQRRREEKAVISGGEGFTATANRQISQDPAKGYKKPSETLNQLVDAI